MDEVVHPRGGDPVTLRPCPPWCTLYIHFNTDSPIDTDAGYHHRGPELAVPTNDRASLHDPYTIVKVTLKSWTHPLDAEPGPTQIELQLAEGETNTDRYAELTSGQARAIATALLTAANIAEPSTDSDRTFAS
jgi:hypothetical protein